MQCMRTRTFSVRTIIDSDRAQRFISRAYYVYVVRWRTSHLRKIYPEEHFFCSVNCVLRINTFSGIKRILRNISTVILDRWWDRYLSLNAEILKTVFFLLQDIVNGNRPYRTDTTVQYFYICVWTTCLWFACNATGYSRISQWSVDGKSMNVFYFVVYWCRQWIKKTYIE